jgi:hypothetical protein
MLAGGIQDTLDFSTFMVSGVAASAISMIS